MTSNSVPTRSAEPEVDNTLRCPEPVLPELLEEQDHLTTVDSLSESGASEISSGIISWLDCDAS